jgi:hypothetical protein
MPASIRVVESADAVAVELVDLENVGALPLTVCLDNVVIQRDAVGPACGVQHFASCVAMAPRSRMSGAFFRGRSSCNRLPTGEVRVLAQIRYRRTSSRTHADVWETLALLIPARVRRL